MLIVAYILAFVLALYVLVAQIIAIILKYTTPQMPYWFAVFLSMTWGLSFYEWLVEKWKSRRK
jgi:hypothetical protein